MKITDECLKSYIKEGLSQAKIARACNMSRQAVNQRISYRRKIPEKKKLVRDLLKKGHTMKEISKKLDHKSLSATYQTVKKWGFKLPMSNPKRRRASIIFWASKGYSYSEIAKEINTTFSNVYHMCKRNNIKTRAFKGMNNPAPSN